MTEAPIRGRRTQFRTHDGTTPGELTSPLFRKLISEWVDLNTAETTSATMRQLGKRQPILAAYKTPGEIVDAIDTANHSTREDMLAALLRLFQDGHQLAGRILLHQFLPLISAITKTRSEGTETHWIEDRRHIAVAEFWHLTSTLDIDYYAGHLLGDISWMLRRRFTKLTNEDARQIPHGDIGDIIDANTATTETEPLKSDHYNLRAILDWAQNTAIITEADSKLLTTIYIDGNRFTQTAQTMGVKPTTLSQRAHRAIQKIRDNVEEIPEPTTAA